MRKNDSIRIVPMHRAGSKENHAYTGRGKLAVRLLRVSIPTFCNDKQGSVAIIFAIALIPLAIAMGAAIDYGRANAVKASMQASIDATVLQIVQQGDRSISAAQNLFNANWHTSLPVSLTIAESSVDDSRTITMTASTDVPTVMLGIAGIDQMNVSVLSKAKPGKKLDACVIALSPDTTGLETQGGGIVEVRNCGVHVNSITSKALVQKGSGSIKAKTIRVVGYASAGKYSPIPITNQAPIDDPLAGIPEPVVPSTCTYENQKFNSVITFSAGVTFCGTIQFNADVQFQPGMYYFKDASISTASSVRLTGQEVTFFFGPNNSWDSSGSGLFSLSAPTTGNYKGIVLFGSRASGGMELKLTGGKDYNVNGTIYLPNGRLEVQGNSDFSVSAKTGYVIARQFSYSGNSSFIFEPEGSPAPDALKMGGAVLMQ